MTAVLPAAPRLAAPPAQAGTAAGAAQRPRMLSGMRGVFLRDVRVALRRRADAVAVLLFFLVVACLFPLAVGPEPARLRAMGAGVVWVSALLASMLSLPRLFADDQRDGSLEQLLLAPTPLPLLVLAKMAAHWLVGGLPLALLSPLLALQFDLSMPATLTLTASLLLGTPLLSLLGGIGAALTVGVRGAGVLVALLVLPLVTPVLIFGAGAVAAADSGLGVAGHFSLLGALLALGLFLAPWAAAAALRIALE